MSVVHRFEGLQRQIEENFGERIVALRRDIHREPELGFGTEKTAEKVLAALEGLPLEVETGVAETGIVATLDGEGDGPTVALRADMDALPILEDTGLPFASETEGKMHACGHDGHTSMLVGAAHALSGMRDRLDGTVKFVFQPAEEGGGGGKVMVDEGVADGVSSIFALHLWPGLPFGGDQGRPYHGRRRRLRDGGEGRRISRRDAPPRLRRHSHSGAVGDGAPDHRL
jgi:hippurate hydrolase